MLHRSVRPAHTTYEGTCARMAMLWVRGSLAAGVAAGGTKRPKNLRSRVATGSDMALSSLAALMPQREHVSGPAFLCPVAHGPRRDAEHLRHLTGRRLAFHQLHP